MPRPNSVSGGPRSQTLRDHSKCGTSACADDDRRAKPCLNRSAQEYTVGRVGNTVHPLRQIARGLLDGQRLPGERRLAHLQVFHIQQTCVRRHQVTRSEPDDIPRDQLRNRQFPFLSITHHGGCCGNLFPNLCQRVLCLEFHEKVQQNAEEDYGDDDESANLVPQSQGYAAGDEKDDNEGIGKEAKEGEQACEARLLRHAVRAIKTQPPFRLAGGQPGRGCLQQLKQVLQRLVPEALQVLISFFHAGLLPSLPQ